VIAHVMAVPVEEVLVVAGSTGAVVVFVRHLLSTRSAC
jgi:hypothetical protein